MNTYITLLFLNCALFTVAHQSGTCDKITRFINDLCMEKNQSLPETNGPPGSMREITNVENCSCRRTIKSLENKFQSLAEELVTTKETLKRLQMINDNPYVKVYLCGVGLKDRRIPDSSFTASSSDPRLRPEFSRYGFQTLTGDERTGYWGCRHPPRAGQWLQVDLTWPTRITGVVTQGRPRGDEWIEAFTISYGNTSSQLQRIRASGEPLRPLVFRAGPETVNMFPEPVVGRYFRLTALEFRTWVVLRLEYLTC